MTTRIGLRKLLLGLPLHQRHASETQDTHDQQLKAELDLHIEALIELLPRNYSDTEPCKQALLELRHVVQMENLACKRAVLLYGVCSEKEIVDYWTKHDPESAKLAKDLHERVLPFVGPRFLKHSCQCPDGFVRLALTLADMWGGEQLGNWPLSP